MSQVPLTPDQLLALKAKIADAESAYHRLMTGQAVNVFVDQNNETVKYSVTARSDLYAYITLLKSQLPTVDTSYQGWPRPMKFLF